MPEINQRLKRLVDREVRNLVEFILVRVSSYSAYEATKVADYVAYKFDEIRKEYDDRLMAFSPSYKNSTIRFKNAELRDDPYLKSLIDSVTEPIKKRSRLKLLFKGGKNL